MNIFPFESLNPELILADPAFIYEPEVATLLGFYRCYSLGGLFLYSLPDSEVKQEIFRALSVSPVRRKALSSYLFGDTAPRTADTNTLEFVFQIRIPFDLLETLDPQLPKLFATTSWASLTRFFRKGHLTPPQADSAVQNWLNLQLTANASNWSCRQCGLSVGAAYHQAVLLTPTVDPITSEVFHSLFTL